MPSFFGCQRCIRGVGYPVFLLFSPVCLPIGGKAEWQVIFIAVRIGAKPQLTGISTFRSPVAGAWAERNVTHPCLSAFTPYGSYFKAAIPVVAL
jgi:hypothetical protein